MTKIIQYEFKTMLWMSKQCTQGEFYISILLPFYVYHSCKYNAPQFLYNQQRAGPYAHS